MTEADITFVDDNNEVIGSGSKQEAWSKGITCRIARIFLFNQAGELLIQKRADHLASLPGRWDSSAAGHVDAGEEYLEAAERELSEEVQITNIELKELGLLYLDEKDEPEKIKKRFQMIYTGHYDGEVTADSEDVSEVRWISLKELAQWMEEKPEEFTEGFLRSFAYLQEHGT